LQTVELTLRHLQRALAGPRRPSHTPRDVLDERVLENLLAGYAFIDALVTAAVDVFAMGQLRNLLELNALVLCGTHPGRRDAYARHFEATERRFYEERTGGIQDLVEQWAGSRTRSPWERAAALYARMLSRPQLFIEGNHRTGALMMSYVLLTDGAPPFVLSPDSATEYFEVSESLRSLDKGSPGGLLRLPGLKQRLAALLASRADFRHLLVDPEPPPLT
jgi:hypothetical protein